MSSTEQVCAECETGGAGIIACSGTCMRHFHAECAGVSIDTEGWKCPDCTLGIHRCSACKQYDLDSQLSKCTNAACGRRFHSSGAHNCNPKDNIGDGIDSNGACRRHKCAAAACRLKLLSAVQPTTFCVRCSKAYHSVCKPSDVRKLSETYFICAGHSDEDELPPPREEIVALVRGRAGSSAVSSTHLDKMPLGTTSAHASTTVRSKNDPTMHLETGSDNEDDSNFHPLPDADGTMDEDGLVYISREQLQALFAGDLSLFPEEESDNAAANTDELRAEGSSEADEARITMTLHVTHLSPGELRATPDLSTLLQLYPRYRCKVCGLRYEEQRLLAAHVSEHSNLATLLRAPGRPTVELMQHQWFSQPKMLTIALGSLGKVRDTSEDIWKPSGKYCRAWFPS